MRVRVFGPLFEVGIVPRLLGRATRETMEYGKGVIREDTPILTGRLRAGWESDQSTIYNEVPYCRWVEEGTRRMNGRGMVRKNLPAIRVYYLKAIARQIGSLR